jgi:ankyrin repeat protein
VADPSNLLEAIKAGRLDEVERLLDASPELVDDRGRDGDASGPSPILLAIYYRRPEIADAFVRRGAALDIFEASAVGDARRVCELVGADPSLASGWAPDGFFPLGLASFFGRREAVRALLDAKADPNAEARNASHARSVHAAAASRDREILRMLLEAGADPDAAQEAGFVPLHEAANAGDLEMGRLLVEHGARTDVRTEDGRVPADFARAKGHGEMAVWLDAAGGESKPS